MSTEDLLLPAMKDRLFIFDMDGTLLVQTTACLEIARATATLEQLHALESALAGGQIDAFGFAQEVVALWGLLDKKFIREAFDASPKLDNIRRVTSLINRGGGKSCLITMSPSFYAEYFYDFGFDFIEASRLPKSASEEVLREHILNPRDKAVIARRICRELGFALEHCVAFGDSMSDYLLFRELQQTVAVNGDSELRKLARHQYRGTDLYEALLLPCGEILG